MRLIDVDVLMEAINTWPKFGVDERCRIVPWSERYEPYIHLRDAVIAITGMPTIEERKTGMWINNIHDIPICDQCGYMTPYDRAIDDYEYGNYCPNCGADMREQP